jgi:hypothetical protein
MLSKLRPRSIYDVMAAIACFVALAGGTAYAANTIRTGDIVDNEVFTTDVRDDTLGFGGLKHQDLGSGSVGSSEIIPFSINEGDIASNVLASRHINDGTLNDEDISQGTFVNFTGNIGTVPAHNCVERRVTGVNARGDHLLLTPNYETATTGRLVYSAEYTSDDESMLIQACNPTGASINDGTTNFNLLVIDAQ